MMFEERSDYPRRIILRDMETKTRTSLQQINARYRAALLDLMEDDLEAGLEDSVRRAFRGTYLTDSP